MVVALLPESEQAIFKQYVNDSGQAYLKPLNPQYPVILIDASCKMIGVVKRAVIEF